MSSSFGGSGSFGSSGRGEIKYVISVDDAQAVQKLQGVSQQLQTLGQTGQQTGQQMSQLPQTLDQVSIQSDRVSQSTQQSASSLDTLNNSARNVEPALDQIGNNVATMGKEFSATVNPIKNSGDALNQFQGGTNDAKGSLKQFGSVMKESVIGVTFLAQGIVGLYGQYVQLHRTQVTAERSALQVEKAQNKVGDLTIKLEKTVAKYGATSREAAEVQKDLSIAQQNLGIVSEKNVVQQERLSEATANFYTGILPSAVGVISGAVQTVSILGKNMGALKDIIPKVGGAFSGLAGSITAVAGPLALIAGAAFLAGVAIYNAGKIDEAIGLSFGKNVVKMAQYEVAWLSLNRTLGTISDEDRKRLEQWEKQNKEAFEGSTDAIMSSIPPLERFFGISKETEEKIKGLAKQVGVELPKELDQSTAAVEKYTRTFVSLNAEFDALPPGIQASNLSLIEINKSFDFLKEAGVAALTEVQQIMDELPAKTKEWDTAIENTWMGMPEDAQTAFDEVLKISAESSNKIIDDQKKAAEAFAQFAEKSRMDLADALGLKGVDEKVDKLINKITKDLPKKIGDIKLKPKLKMEIDEKVIQQSAGVIVSALSEEIQSSDKAADAVAKSIRDNLPKGDAGDAMKKFLDSAISKSNTGQILTDNLDQDLKTSNYILTIPSTADVTDVKTPWGDLQPIKSGSRRDSMAGFHGGTGGGNTKTYIDIPATAVIKNIFFGPGGTELPGLGGGGIGDIWNGGNSTGTNGGPGGGSPSWFKQFEQLRISDNKKTQDPFLGIIKSALAASMVIRKAFASALQDVYDTMVDLAGQWSKLANSFGKNSASAGKQIRTQFANALQDVYDTMADLAGQWSKLCNSIGKNSASAGKQIRSAFGKALQDVYDTMVDLAKQWSKMCQSMVANAKSAAKQINSAFDSIKDKTVTITTVHKNVTQNVTRFATGGDFVTNGPQMIMVGDNPSGKEHVQITPLGGGSNSTAGGGFTGGTMNQTIKLHISGNDIVNERNLSKKIRFEIGRNMDKFGSA